MTTPAPLTSLTYRPDMDGMRALAVLAVIIFHIDSSFLPGGFLGVDFFFVISGYLMTLLLTRHAVHTQNYGIVTFYCMRIKRILPALFFMIVLTLLTGLILLNPKDYYSLLQSALWSIFSAANIHFFNVTDHGYFAADSRELPLLHLWSLGVEEQFYLLWPVVILYALKPFGIKKNQTILIFVIFLSSLFLSQYLLQQHASFAYYLLPTRLWELLAGALVAIHIKEHHWPTKKWAGLSAVIGITLALASFIFISPKNNIPGIGAAPIVISAMLLISAGPTTFIARFLSFKPLVMIGLLSYSAYLFHWPILAFIRYSLIQITLPVIFSVVAGTFFLSSICYFYIEKPLRYRPASTRNILFFYYLLPVILIILFTNFMMAAIKNKSDLIYSIHSFQEIYLDQTSAGMNQNCIFSHFNPEYMHENRCVYPLGSKPSVLLAGDSNANHFFGMLKILSDHYHFSVRNSTKPSCPILFSENFGGFDTNDRENCVLYRETIKSELSHYEILIIGADWSAHYQKDPDKFLKEFDEMISYASLYSKTIIVMAKVPVIEGFNLDCGIRSRRIAGMDCVKRFSNVFSEAPEVNNKILALTRRYTNVYFVDIRSLLCHESYCSAYYKNIPVYLDASHLNQQGSELIGELMIKNSSSLLTPFEK